MELETAEKELAVRLYRWGQEDGERERQAGYPLLTPARDEVLQKSLAYVRSLSFEDHSQLVIARQKLMQPMAVAMLGETLSANDKAWNDKFRLAMSQIQLEEFSWAEATKIFAVKRSLVAKILLPILTDSIGIKPKKFDSLQWYYPRQFADWRFSTELDLGGTWGTEIRYNFRLQRDDDRKRGFNFYYVDGIKVPNILVFNLHVLYGLGVAPSYAIAKEEQVPVAAQSLVDVRDHIVRFVPEWLAGLEREDSVRN